MKKLSTNHALLLADALGFDRNIITLLNEKNLLNYPVAISLLVKQDYKTIKEEGNTRNVEIIRLLSGKYNRSVSTIEQIVYTKTKPKAGCKGCGKRLSKNSLSKNDGYCRTCNK